MKALVTGASGFIGSHLVEHLIKHGYIVTCLLRKTSNREYLKCTNAEIVIGDLNNSRLLNELVRDKNYVFHLAAVIESDNQELYHKTNVLGTKYLAEACRDSSENLNKFVFISSIAASGPSKKGVLKTEDDECRPINEYGRSKLEAENIIREVLKNIPYVIIRPPNVYGPREKELLHAIEVIKKHIKPLLGNGDRQTSLIYVGDLVRAIRMAAENPTAVYKTYFITDGNTYSWRSITDLIIKELEIKSPFIPIPYPVLLLAGIFSAIASKILKKAPAITIQRIKNVRKNYYIYDSSRAYKELGFLPEISLEEGIKRVISWYRDYTNGAQKTIH